MNLLFLVARPARWFDHPDLRVLEHKAAIKRLPLGLAWTFAPPANWIFYTPNDARALWLTLTSPNRHIVGWGIGELDLPLVRSRAGGSSWPAKLIDLQQIIAEATGRRYTLQFIGMANFDRIISVTNADIAGLLAAGQIIPARRHCRAYAELVAESYLHLLEGKPLKLLARQNQGETEDLAFFLNDKHEWHVEHRR